MHSTPTRGSLIETPAEERFTKLKFETAFFPTKTTNSFFYACCISEDRAVINKYINKNYFNINEADGKGDTALHHCAEHGKLNIIKILLNHNAHIDSCNNLGYTPLFRAIVNGHREIVSFLLKKKASINHVDKDGYSGIFRYFFFKFIIGFSYGLIVFNFFGGLEMGIKKITKILFVKIKF